MRLSVALSLGYPLVREASQSSKLSNLPLRTSHNRAATQHGVREA